jgi:hypothetical protein
LGATQKAKQKWKHIKEAIEAEAPGQENNNEEDGYDGNIPIPQSVLKECTESFRAPDEACIKTRTQFFDDTGVMPLLC